MSDCSPDCNDLGSITNMASCWPAGRRVILNAFNAIYNIRCKGQLCVRNVAANTPTDEFMAAFNDLQPADCDCPILFIIEGCNIWAGGNLLGDECDLSCSGGDTHYGPCLWHLLNQNPDDAIYGERATIWVGEMFYQAGGISTSLNNLDPDQIYNTNTSAAFDAILDLWDASFLLKGGSYDFSLLCRTQNNAGIVTVIIDGAVQGTIDLYSFTLTANVIQTIPVSILDTGRHVVRLQVTDLNPSSVGYLASMTKLWLKPTADSIETV